MNNLSDEWNKKDPEKLSLACIFAGGAIGILLILFDVSYLVATEVIAVSTLGPVVYAMFWLYRRIDTHETLPLLLCLLGAVMVIISIGTAIGVLVSLVSQQYPVDPLLLASLLNIWFMGGSSLIVLGCLGLLVQFVPEKTQATDNEEVSRMNATEAE